MYTRIMCPYVGRMYTYTLTHTLTSHTLRVFSAASFGDPLRSWSASKGSILNGAGACKYQNVSEDVESRDVLYGHLGRSIRLNTRYIRYSVLNEYVV